MNVFRNYRHLLAQPRVICLGNFDGVHRGHQKVIQTAVEEAKRLQIASTIFTFEPHPRTVLGRPVEILLTLEDRLDLLKRFDVAEILLQSFDEGFSKIGAKHFVEEVLISTLQAKAVVIGENFHFGFRAEGNVDFLKTYAAAFHTIKVEPVKSEGGEISSSALRNLLKKSSIEDAADGLNYLPFISGTVIAGDARGRKIGFPTANLEVVEGTIAGQFATGVYACVVQDLGSGKFFEAVANFGFRPTFKKGNLLWEVHLLKFDGDLYGRRLRVFLVSFLRSEKSFSSVDLLKAEIQNDCLVAGEKLRQRLVHYGVNAVTSAHRGVAPRCLTIEDPCQDLQSFQPFNF